MHGYCMDACAIGRRVRDLRKQLGINTTQLGQRAGITQAQVSRLENGLQGFRSATLERIAKALKVEPAYFFIDAEQTKSPAYGAVFGRGIAEALRSAEYTRAAETLALLHRKQTRTFKLVAGLLDVMASGVR